MKIKIFPDLSDLSRAAARQIVEIGENAVKQNGKFTIALAGGSSPKVLYRLLTTEDFKVRMDWTRVFFFFGDERSVLPDDEESNFRMANENLLKPLEIAEGNIFRWQTELEDAEKIAENYEQTIKEFFALTANEFPRFDLILLGMGNDGHTASLFPFSKALGETKKIAVANRIEKLDTNRLTLTFPAINNSANVIFLISGVEKAETLQKVLEGRREPEKFPSQAVELTDGKLLWLIDEQAAQFLTNK